jgi:DNA-binding transcriptional ArsR family regulator
MWQSDFIHWRLADETDVEILNWLDDHSRLLLSCSAHGPVTGDVVVSVFLGLVEEYGPPASTLTDNGSVYTLEAAFVEAGELEQAQRIQARELEQHLRSAPRPNP